MAISQIVKLSKDWINYTMLKYSKKLVVSLSFLIISGCSIIPGSHMEGVEVETETSALEQDLSNVNISVINL